LASQLAARLEYSRGIAESLGSLIREFADSLKGENVMLLLWYSIEEENV